MDKRYGYDCPRLDHTATGSGHRDHLQIESPAEYFRTAKASDMSNTFGVLPRLTGIPQLVEIPAPVITTIFFDLVRTLAIFCS